MKKWYQSRTMWLAVLTVAGAVADAVVTGGSVGTIVVGVIGALNGFFRSQTDTMITK
jgi:uncharacterized membrane protein YeaQ/YmgE (transglycosylase-associated protein family)